MAYINTVNIGETDYLIEPTLYIAPSLSGTAYTASLTNFTLDTGVTVQAKFATTNPASATLNINSTGAKAIYYNNAAAPASLLKVNHIYTLVFDGTYWQIVGDIDTNTQSAYGNINTSGQIGQTSGWTLANGDGLIVFDSSNSNKLERTGITFDASTETSVLSKKGTWVSMYTHPDTAGNKHIPSGGSTGQFLQYGGSSGTASWHTLAAADIPALSYLKLDGSNNMTADVNIIAGDTDKFVNFWYSTDKKAGASWRIGMNGSGTNDANYFTIDSGTSTTSATTWNTALRIGQNTYNVYLPSTTASTTTATGALTVAGGVGVAGQVTALRLAANGSNTSYSLYVNGNAAITKSLKLAGTTADDAAIHFSRTGTNTPNYINVPTSSALAISVGGVAGTNIRLAIQDDCVHPWQNGTINLGGTNQKWKDVYATTFKSGTWNGTQIGVTYGGTGTTTAPTQGGIIYGSSTTAYASTAAGTSGQVLKSNGTSAPEWANEYSIEIEDWTV